MAAPVAAQLRLFLCLQDNYGVLLHDPSTGKTAAIDAPEAAPVEAALKGNGWKLTDILVTHYHGDHTGGIAAVKQQRFRRWTRRCAKAIPSRSATSPRMSWKRRAIRSGTLLTGFTPTSSPS